MGGVGGAGEGRRNRRQTSVKTKTYKTARLGTPKGIPDSIAKLLSVNTAEIKPTKSIRVPLPWQYYRRKVPAEGTV